MLKRTMVLLAAVALLSTSAAIAEPFHLSPIDPNHLSAARVRALEECNAKAAPYNVFDKWINFQFSIYRSCMAEHGQME
jgi:hypothetical protein